MRTTVTLDEDVAAKLHQLARERGVSFKAALNTTVRTGLTTTTAQARSFQVHPSPLGIRPDFNVEKALSLAADLEDSEILRKLELRK